VGDRALEPKEADGWRLKLFIQLCFDSLVSQGLDMCIVNCVMKHLQSNKGSYAEQQVPAFSELSFFLRLLEYWENIEPSNHSWIHHTIQLHLLERSF
jgi:hypothetical protein